MRWNREAVNPEYVQGDRRTIKKFLFLPKCLRTIVISRKELGGKRKYYEAMQWRWLEFAEVTQIFQEYRGDPPVSKWVDYCWVY